MKKLFLLSLLLFVTFAVSNIVFGQTKTITNADLEKFRVKRMQQEEDYRANYKRLGMPSPEELAARETQRQKELAQFAAKARVRQQQIESNIVQRANILRTQFASVNAQIRYFQTELSRLPNRKVFYTVAYPVETLQSLNFYTKYGSVSIGFGNYGYPNYYGAYPVQYVQPQSYERQEIVLTIRGLEQQKAGLSAQWDALADEARAAGLRID
jgi:hypothetical protein